MSRKGRNKLFCNFFKSRYYRILTINVNLIDWNLSFLIRGQIASLLRFFCWACIYQGATNKEHKSENRSNQTVWPEDQIWIIIDRNEWWTFENSRLWAAVRMWKTFLLLHRRFEVHDRSHLPSAGIYAELDRPSWKFKTVQWIRLQLDPSSTPILRKHRIVVFWL